jgi:hypothetical protein
MSTNSVQRSHSYPYRFPSLIKDVHEFNARWSSYVIHGQEKYAQEVINLEEASKALDLRYGSPTPPGFNEKLALERQQDAVTADLVKIRKAREQLTYSLQISARMLVEMWQEMVLDFNNSELPVVKYIEYLRQFAEILETGTCHNIFHELNFQAIQKEIGKYLPAKS